MDDVPWLLRPIFLSAGWILGLAIYFYIVLIRRTCAIKVERDDSLEADADYIYCFWHEAVYPYFCSFPRSRYQIVINHPLWYMKPIHVALRLMGTTRLILGSAGYSGAAAAKELAEALRRGCSTSIAVDGPYGPAKRAKKGVVALALRGGVPLVPVRCEVEGGFRLGGWDRKIIPVPFRTRILVRMGAPIAVKWESVPECLLELERGL